MLKTLRQFVFAAASIAAMTSAAGAETLILGHSTWVGYGPFYIAQANGYFEEEGIDLELQVMENTPIKMGALMAGQIDLVASTADEFPTYMKPDIPLHYFLAVDNSNGGDGVVSRTDITTVDGLRGRTVAFEEGSVSQFFINALLREAGMTQDDIEMVNMTATDAGVAFTANQVDAAVTWEPHLSQGSATDHGHLLVDSSQKPGLIVDVVAARRDTVEEHRGELEALVRAWQRALDFLASNPDEAFEMMAAGVGGWLEDPDEFRATVTGIEYLGIERNREMFGTAEAPGQLDTTLRYAIDIWTDFDKIQVEGLTSADVLDRSFIN
jgi:NitT/TauT family transport system substrate-binding protein